jgi:flagellin FlaB
MPAAPRRRSRRGIVGIEAAIVMIAFVIVAAALAFVALNMGMTSTQKTKEAIGASMGEAGSSLLVDGDVIAWYNKTENGITHVIIPIRPASGKYPIDLNINRTTISLQEPDTYYANIYNITPITNISDTNISTLIDKVNTTASATIVFIVNDGDNVLEYGEKAVVVVAFTNPLKSYETFRIEIKPPEGSPLVIERTIPASLPTDSGPVNLG